MGETSTGSRGPPAAVDTAPDQLRPTPEPGWYEDPSHRFVWRWWNGTRWTADVGSDTWVGVDPPLGWWLAPDGRWHPPPPELPPPPVPARSLTTSQIVVGIVTFLAGVYGNMIFVALALSEGGAEGLSYAGMYYMAGVVASAGLAVWFVSLLRRKPKPTGGWRGGSPTTRGPSTPDGWT